MLPDPNPKVRRRFNLLAKDEQVEIYCLPDLGQNSSRVDRSGQLNPAWTFFIHQPETQLKRLPASRKVLPADEMGLSQ
jgi:hypothetical protein